MNIEKYIEQAKAFANSSAFNGVSFDPEKRAARFSKECESYLREAANLCDEYNLSQEQGDRIFNKIITLAQTCLSRQGRCISWVISGRGNFPVRQQEKRRGYLENAQNEYYEFIDNLEKYIKKLGTPKLSQSEKANEWQIKAAALRKLQEEMKEANKQARKEGKECPYPTYKLTNNLANIKRLEAQVQQVERMQGEIKDDIVFNGGVAKYDPEEIRWNISFDNIPEEAIRKVLKCNGFKWSPRREAWTRGAKTMSRNRLENILKSL